MTIEDWGSNGKRWIKDQFSIVIFRFLATGEQNRIGRLRRAIAYRAREIHVQTPVQHR
jgi:hypothetical protein